MKLDERMPRLRRCQEDSSEASSMSSYRRKRHHASDCDRVSSRSTYTSSKRGKYEDSESSTHSRRRRKRTRSRSEHKRRRRGHSSRLHSKHSKENQKEGREKDEKHSSSKDDKDGHLVYQPGDWLHSRYEIISTLGEGTFAKCLECFDSKRQEAVAVKVIKNIERYRDAAKLEIKVLEEICRKTSIEKDMCILLMDWFDHHGHICLVFEKLGLSVFEFMKDNSYQGYPLDHVRSISQQLTTAIKFLHSFRLCHTDLKPENMLFVDTTHNVHLNEKEETNNKILQKTNIKVIDFGSATFEDEHHSTTVSTRHYRAPEVVLELGWSYPCDMWSIGCIMFELYTGFTLFQTHENKEHLAMMERILGTLPSSMCWKSKKAKYFYKGRLDWDERSSDGKYVRENCKSLWKYANSKDEQHNLFFDLLERLLEYRPDKRITARDALQHPFYGKHCSLKQRTDSTSPRTSR